MKPYRISPVRRCQLAMRNVVQVISEQSMRQRFILIFRASFAVIALGAALSGRTPPAHAQTPPAVSSAEGTLLEFKIQANRDSTLDLRAQVAVLAAAQIEQGKEQVRQDTKISVFFSILSVLSTGGIVLQFQKKKTA